MQETIQELVEIAQSLDEAGSEKLAAQLDELSGQLLDTKVAQYVGLQGYWVRNTRCWSNCYRQKRAQTPSMPAQEVWGECHSEYLDSINNDGSSWDKYAETDEGLVKVASQKESLDRQFDRIMSEKLEKGASVGHAVFEALEELQSNHEEQEVRIATALFDLSSDTFEKDPQAAVKIAHVAEKIVRESQLWRGLGSALQGIGSGVRDSVRYHSYIQDIQSRANQAARVMSGLSQSISNAQQYFNNTQVQSPGQIPRHEAARQILNQISTDVMQVDSVLQNINRNVTNVLRGVAQEGTSNFMGTNQNQTPPSAPGGTTPTINPTNPPSGQPTGGQQGGGQPAAPQGFNSTITGPTFQGSSFDGQQTYITPPNQLAGPTSVIGPGVNQTTKPRYRVPVKGRRPGQGDTGYISPQAGANSKVKEGKTATSVAYNRSKALANNGGA